MQHVRLPLKAQKVSAPAQPELTYTWEPLASALREFAPLLDRMIREVGHNHAVTPLDPDYAQYLAVERCGILHFLAVRDEGRLVGFVLVTLGPHLDFMTTKWAQIQKIYLRPEYRGAGHGQQMRDRVHAQLKTVGVKIVMAAERNACPTPLWAQDGYKPLETVYIKVLE